MFKTWLHMTEQGSYQIQEVNVLVRITDASDKWERGNCKFTHTHTHIPNWTGNSHSVKSCIVPVFCTNHKQCYFPGVDKFCLFVCHLLISFSWFVSVWFSLYLLFPLVFGCVVTDRPSDIYRDPSFLFPKAPKKRAEAVSVASPQSVYNKTRWGQCRVSLAFAL